VGADRTATASLTDLGLALWRAAGAAGGRWEQTVAVEELRALEGSLGVLGAEAARGMAGAPAPPVAPPGPRPAGIDADALLAFLDRDHRALRDEVRHALGHAALTIPPGLSVDEYRARVLTAVRHLAGRGWGRLGYPEAYGGAADPAAAVAVFETLAFGDLSVVVKFGVQFGLFGGSVHQLGTERHHAAYLPSIGSLELPGCYAMTETSHGSNVRDLETTATYDADTDELEVHTPSEGAGKDYIGNAALHGRMATVFARLRVGDRDHGVHAVLVPLRDAGGGSLPGVRIEDRGLKLGLNGVDNGRIWFDRVRVPRANLLDRFGTIDERGAYRSPISSSGRRFFTMLRTLVAGRVSIAAASVSAAKVGLTIAVRYADDRRQFGPKNAPETPILDYPVVQRALMPRLATTYGLHFAARALQRDYAASGSTDDPELEVTAAGLKAYASDHCVETLQACREACGGQGYMAAMRFAALKADTDVFTTFEGANDVLYQLVAKGLLSRYRDQMGDLNLWRALQYLGERAETRLTGLNPVTTRRTDRDHLLDEGFHAATFAYREARLLRSAAARIRARLQDGVDSFVAVTEVQDHLVTLARAHIEHVVLLRMHDAVAAAPTPALSEHLRTLAALFALSRVEADRAWFLESGYVEAGKSRAIRVLVGALSTEAREVARPLVDAFGVPAELLPAVVGGAGA
jgi:acyl-CoA oxidase